MLRSGMAEVHLALHPADARQLAAGKLGLVQLGRFLAALRRTVLRISGRRDCRFLRQSPGFPVTGCL
jgi:hypothetical protein